MPMTHFRQLKRHSFQLLEIMVAAFLVVVCAAPVIRIYSTIYVQQQKIAEINSLNRIVHHIHFLLIEKMYKHAIPMEQILSTQRFPVEENEVKEPLQKLGYHAFYTFSDYQKKGVKKKEEGDKPVQNLVTLTVTLTPHHSRPTDREGGILSYPYKVFISTSDQELPAPIQSEDTPSTEEIEEDSSEDLDNKPSKPLAERKDKG